MSASSGGTCSGSDERLKTDISDLSGSEGLAAVLALRPVTFNWKDAQSAAAQGLQLGFLAQQVQSVLPELVLDDSGTTTITLADGSTQEIPHTLSLNYQKLVVPIVKAIQELNLKLEDLATTTATTTLDQSSFTSRFFSSLFARLTQWFANATNGIRDFYASVIHGERVETRELCVGETCVTPDQFKAVFGSGSQSAAAGAPEQGGTEAPVGDASAAGDQAADDETATTTASSTSSTSNIVSPSSTEAEGEAAVSQSDVADAPEATTGGPMPDDTPAPANNSSPVDTLPATATEPTTQ